MLVRMLAALFLPLALGAQGSSHQPPKEVAPSVDPPRLEISPKGRQQLGSVGPREQKNLVYTFTNTSAAAISLRVGDLSPGVTVKGPALDQPIGPKASAALTMTIDPTDFVGVQRRNVKLLTDDPKQGQYLLPVEMHVRPDVTVDQARKSFGEVASHESPQLGFTFKRESGDPLQVRLTTALPEYLELEADTATSATEFRFTFRPAKVAPGVQLGLETLKVETNAPQQPHFTLYVDWKLRRPVEATPARLIFLEARDRKRHLDLKQRDGKPFVLLSASIEGNDFALEVLPKGAATEHRLIVHRQASREAKAMLVLRFEGQDEPLEVPLAYLPAVALSPK